MFVMHDIRDIYRAAMRTFMDIPLLGPSTRAITHRGRIIRTIRPRRTSRYMPHQNERECSRRVRQGKHLIA